MDDATLFRSASISAGIAIITLIIAGVAFALFLGGAGAIFGPINDLAVVATVVALILPILAIDRVAADTAPWLRWVSIAAIAGCVLIAVGQTLLVVGVLPLDGSFVTGGIGVVPVLAWMVALVVLGLGAGPVPSTIGFAAAVVLLLIVAEVVAAGAGPGPALWLVSIALLGSLVAWLGILVGSFVARASA